MAYIDGKPSPAESALRSGMKVAEICGVGFAVAYFTGLMAISAAFATVLAAGFVGGLTVYGIKSLVNYLPLYDEHGYLMPKAATFLSIVSVLMAASLGAWLVSTPILPVLAFALLGMLACNVVNFIVAPNESLFFKKHPDYTYQSMYFSNSLASPVGQFAV
jgi:hypothetical protein